jgi:hypothetical protein
MKTGLAVLIGLAVAVNGLALGQVDFRNTPLTGVTYNGVPVEPGIAVAGLYFSADLSAVPDPSIPVDSFTLVATTLIGANPSFPGVYSGGRVTIPGMDQGQEVLLQVRAWSAEFSTYEAAFNSGTELIGAGNVMLVTLGETMTPIPNISTAVESFWLGDYVEPPVEPPPATVPEGGSSLVLLGLAVAGIFCGRTRRN